MSEEKKPEKKAASKVGTVIGVVVLVVACVTGGWIACDMWPKDAPPKPEVPFVPPSVEVRAVEECAFLNPERFVAHIEPCKEVDILPQVDGYVKELKFKEGDIVKKGDVLYVLDAERYEAIVNQRKADLVAAEAEERRAARYWQRIQKLDSKSISELERDNAEAGAESAKAAVLQAKANLIVAEYDLKKTTVVAPITGQIGKSAAYEGDYVAPARGVLARIVQTDPVRVSFPVSDRDYIQWCKEGFDGFDGKYRMRLLLPDGKNMYDKVGKFAFVDNEMSKGTGSVLVRAEFLNPDNILLPNTFVTLIRDAKAEKINPCVYEQSLFVLENGKQAVWVVKDNGAVELREVEVGNKQGRLVPVTKGLAKGEKVAITAVSKLADKMTVKVVSGKAVLNDDLDPNYKSPIKD